MEIRFNELSGEWEVLGPNSPLKDGEPMPLFTADSLEAATAYAQEEEGWI